MKAASPRQLVIYVREGCHLCEDAMEAIAKVCDELPATTPPSIEIELRDVDADQAVSALFGNDVPVLTLDDKIVFRHRVDTDRLRTLLQNTETA